MTSASTTPSTITNAGPLTTTFTPPASCLADLYCDPPDNTFFFCVQGVSCGSVTSFSLNPTLLTECFPSYSLLNFANMGPLFGTPIVYSPGLICPQGYTTALQQIGPKGIYQTEVYTISTDTSLQTQLLLTVTTAVTIEDVSPGETAVACCPR